MHQSDPNVAGGQTANTAARPASVLLLDDDDDVRLVIATALADAGYQVTETGDPIQVLRLLESELPFDALIIDVIMPPGAPHGISVGSMAACKRPGIKVIHISGYADRVSEWHVRSDHLPILPKPLRTDDLIAVLRRRLEQGAAS